MRLKNSLLAVALSVLLIPISAGARYGSMSTAGASAARSTSTVTSSARSNSAIVRTSNSRVMVQNNNMILMGVGMATAYAILYSSDPKDYCSNKMFMTERQVRIPCLSKPL